tara:strand:+ start:281 stop:517 length:237 start_codon:yes stop_codon:yes gene_type:complete
MKKNSKPDNYEFNKLHLAVKKISAAYGVSEHQVISRLQEIVVFGVCKSSLGTERIIDLWDDHCANDFEYDCEEIGLVA